MDKVLATNKKEQMPPQRLITLTRGIQIRGQPIENYKKKIKILLIFFQILFLFFIQQLIFALKTMKKQSSKVAHNS